MRILPLWSAASREAGDEPYMDVFTGVSAEAISLAPGRNPEYFPGAITSPRPNRDGTDDRKSSQTSIIANNKSPPMASPELPYNSPDNRIEPSILSDLAFDDDTRNTAEPASHRLLSATVLISVLAHAVILFMAAYVASRDVYQAEPAVARPSIQIRFQPPPPVEAAAETVAETVAESPPETQERPPATNPGPAPTNDPMPEEQPSESIAEAPAETPQIQLPSLTDLRTAARNRAEQDRQHRLTHPDCLSRERRNAFLDCDGDGDGDQPYDYARATQNATVTFFTPALPTDPAGGREELTSTGARVKAAIDMVDNQLGTTQTKKRIMNFP